MIIFKLGSFSGKKKRFQYVNIGKAVWFGESERWIQENTAEFVNKHVIEGEFPKRVCKNKQLS